MCCTIGLSARARPGTDAAQIRLATTASARLNFTVPLPRSAAQGPLLVGLAVAGPQLQLGAVGGGGAAGVETQPGLDAGDGAVGVEVPLLVGLAVAVPDDDGGAVAGASAVGVQTLVTGEHELPVGVGPALVGGAGAVKQLGLGAVGGGAARHVDAA